MGDLRRPGAAVLTGRLAGEVAVVTGIAGGIGAAVARRFVDEGAHVAGLDVRAPDEALGIADIACMIGDVSDRPLVDRFVAGVLADRGHIDILVQAAARLGGSGPFLEVEAAAWDDYIRTNLTGAFVVGQAVARAMAAKGTRGRIINIGSVNAFAAEPGAAPYVASKGGLRMLTKAMAVDLAAQGITVNMIAPGPITVPRNAALFATEAMVRTFGRDIPVRGPGSPAEVANAAVFLAEAGSGFTTGAELVVDGGLLSQILPADR